MRISTTLEGLAGRGVGGWAGLLRERLVQLGVRARGRTRGRTQGRTQRLARAARDVVSKAAVQVFGQLRARLEAATGATCRGKRMRVVESLALGGRRQLLLVRCDEQEYLVGTGPDSVETIVLRQPAPAAPAGTAEPGAGQAPVAQAAPPQAVASRSAAGRALSSGANAMRAGVVFRERPEHGPWLVTAPGRDAVGGKNRGGTPNNKGGMLNNRIEEAGSGQGRESWQ